MGGEGRVLERWKEYFEELLNVGETMREVEDSREMDVEIVEGGRGEREGIEMGEIEKALCKVKKGKAPGMDGIQIEMIKGMGMEVKEWLLRLFNVCWKKGKVPQEWQVVCLVPIYKGKGDRTECGSYRGISLMSVVGKLYGRIIEERCRRKTENLIGEEQGGFRKGRGCMDQIFTFKSLSEKFVEMKREMYVCFMDLEKAYDRVDRENLFSVLYKRGVRGGLLNAVKAFYKNSMAGVRMGHKVGDLFEVKGGLRQGCVMSPWLFNLYLDDVIKGMNREGRGVRINYRGEKEEVSVLLFADDGVLMAETEQKLGELVEQFRRECEQKGLRVNVNKTKVMRVGERGEGGIGGENVRIGGERVERERKFRYLGVDLMEDGCMDGEIEHRLAEGNKVLGGLREIFKKGVSKAVKMRLYESVLIPTLTYGCEAWVVSAKVKKKIEVLEMRVLREIVGVRRVDRIRNARVRNMCESGVSLMGLVEKRILRWFGHLIRMNEERLVKRVMTCEIEGRRGRGRPGKRWMDCLKEILIEMGLSWEEKAELARDRKRWRGVVGEGIEGREKMLGRILDE